MSRHRVVLVLCAERRRAESLVGRCGRLGYIATVPFGAETEIRAFYRAQPAVVLIDLQHAASGSDAFLRAAAASRARVVLLGGGVEDRQDGRILLLGRAAGGVSIAPGDLLEALLTTVTPRSVPAVGHVRDAPPPSR